MLYLRAKYLNRILGKASKYIANYDHLGVVRKGLARSQLGCDLENLQKELEAFGARFRVSMKSKDHRSCLHVPDLDQPLGGSCDPAQYSERNPR